MQLHSLDPHSGLQISLMEAGSEDFNGRKSEFGGLQPGLLAAIYLNERMSMVRLRLSGIPGTRELPAGAYEGVAVRMSSDGERACLDLRHREVGMTLALTDWDLPERTVHAWQVWARRLRLPMLLVQADGSAALIRRALSDQALTLPRRFGSATRLRRPRFLVCRRTGTTSERPVYRDAREIISYE